MKDTIEHTKSSGNVYRDLGFPDHDKRLAKAKLATRINELIKEQKLKQVDAAKILEITQPKVSALSQGNLHGFSMEKLIHFLNLLNQDVEILIKSRKRRFQRLGRLKVAFA